jgi:hypothetical protein
MSWSVDARIPVELVAPAGLAAALADGPPAALLVEAPPDPMPAGAVAQVSWDATVTSHAAACACCAGRSGVALALDRLFQARVRGGCAWFSRVVAVGDAAAVRAALAEDALAAARFRLVAAAG